MTVRSTKPVYVGHNRQVPVIEGGLQPGGSVRSSTNTRVISALSGGIGILSILTAAAWLGLAWVPGGPDGTAGRVALGVACIGAVAVGIVLLVAPRTGPVARVVFLGAADLGCALVALSCSDARVGLASTVTLGLVGSYAAFFTSRRVTAGQVAASAVVIIAVLVVGLAGSDQSIGSLYPFAAQAAFAGVFLTAILHYGFAAIGTRNSLQTGGPMRDELTEVLTRHGLYSAASTSLGALNRKDYLVVVRVHLDQFQDIAVGDGRERGEQVLKRVASRLAQGVRGGDFVARTGDAEFSALAGVTHEGVRIFANRFRELVFSVEDPVPVSASVGVAFAPTPIPSTGVQVAIDALLDRAEVAMRTAQDAGGDRVEIDWSVPDPVPSANAEAHS
ncbi:diguanylate cyclase (GGDEF) domain-containing protein [Williamsia maris]|uniref:Diguanylate cyclase (GGDEF) domain-containing protein n=1 Tax=Williamsia maris TaxID=72806 RepID=A0ABT1HCX1_9NOCA|nr:diguanylate cyclase (GGDEF) domain-containing protein [Williamsia maris]